MLAAREHSRRELRRKLAKRQVEPELLEQVLDRLQQTGLQSDERFTESFIESRVRKGQGPVRIRSELRERGIGAALIERYLEIYEDEWRALLENVHDAKYGVGRVRETKELAKRARFLEYRGFPGELIRQFLLD
ncbi:MAG: recombination regulator RecX [Candidatus Thiodiazotropha sp. (ex Semelilucina semeliformis)]|nr:recombination regulator RecX [Candidatus Thiodiazotropha sp. (ex Myrtea spinifera)]MCU7808170.1 recombination regulator RecX [Candidatus Thiodiazotropha sp. (ex Semelilucina semeliformis)]